MAASMTAYGRTEEDQESGRVIWEIKTLNHRYLESNLRLPDSLKMLESTVRKRLSERLGRGKVDCSLHVITRDHHCDELVIDETLVNKLIERMESVSARMSNPAPMNAMEILAWPGTLVDDPPTAESLGASLLEQLQATLDSVLATRVEEGKKLAALVLKRCDRMTELLTHYRKRLPGIHDELRQKLKSKSEALSVSLDPERLEQEILLLAQKSDVTEELERLEAHLDEVRAVFDRDGPIGKRLDFLMQELNREANTLACKAVDLGGVNASVECKVLIEQMREQVQNIE